jgi:hypothetical protein
VVLFTATAGETHCKATSAESSMLTSGEEVVISAIRFGSGYAVESVEAGGRETSQVDGEADCLVSSGEGSYLQPCDDRC